MYAIQVKANLFKTLIKTYLRTITKINIFPLDQKYQTLGL